MTWHRTDTAHVCTDNGAPIGRVSASAGRPFAGAMSKGRVLGFAWECVLDGEPVASGRALKIERAKRAVEVAYREALGKKVGA